MIGLGIVGCGWAAGEIVRVASALPGLRIVAVCDTDATRAEALAQRARATVAPSVAALLAEPAISTVYVGLPHALLPAVTAQALAAGKHVLAEKPLALDAAEALRLGALADARRLKLAVFFELRRSGTVEKARRLVPRIGTPRLIRIRTLIDKPLDYWGPPGAFNWRARRAAAGGGVVMMNTIHQLDTVRYITGLDYVTVAGITATFAAPAGVEVEDTAAATITLSNGALMSLVASAHAPGASGAETIEIEGERGRLDLPDPFGSAPLRLHENTGGWSEVAVERPDSHRAMLQAFLEAIENDTPVPAGAADAAAALSLVNGLYRSAAEQRTVTLR